VGQQHPSLWHLLQCIQQDKSAAVADIVADARGQLPAKRLRRNAQTASAESWFGSIATA